MKKLTTSVLAIVLTSTFAVGQAQQKKRDTAIKEQKIGEVVITGALGIKKKADEATTAQQVIGGSELNQASSANAVSALAGKVSGLQITQTNSSVNGDFSILIRGVRTITGSNEALVVIDDVISTAANLQQLPPEAIESINVIKGGAGAILYGSQGINGVLVVTTKRGTKGKRMTVTLNSSADFESIAFLPERQNEYGQGWDGNKVNVENGAWGPAFTDPTYAGQILPYGIPLYDYNGNGVINTNPGDFTPAGDEEASIMSPFKSLGNSEIKKFFKTGTLYQNSVTVNAGDGDGYVLMNIGNVHRDFLIQDDTMRRTTAMFKGGIKAGKWRFDGVFNYSHQKTSETSNDIYYWLLQSASDIPITKWKDYPDNAYGWNLYYQNPYFNIKHNRNNVMRNYFNIVGSAQYNVNDHINILYRANVQYISNETQNWNDGWVPTIPIEHDPVNIVSSYYKYDRTTQNFSGDLIVSFDYDLTKDLHLNANAGHSYYETRTNRMSAGGSGLIIPGYYSVWNLTNPAMPWNLDNGKSFSNIHSFFGNIDLGFRDYLFLNAAARYEMASSLPIDNQDYFYPTVGVSFIPTKAWDFGGNVLSYLKINGAISRVGNSSAIGAYAIQNRAVLGSGYPYPANAQLSFVTATSQVDKNIKPEFTTKKEVGLTAGFFNDRIVFDGAYYREDTDDLITNASTSHTTGMRNILFNIGKLKGTGFELNLNATPFKTSDVRWDIGVSMSHNKTMVVKLTDDAKSVQIAGSSIAGLYAEEGQELAILKGIGYQRDDQGRVIVDETTGLPKLATDLVNFGRVTPKYILGLNTKLKVKGFTLAATMDYRTGHKFFSGTLQSFTFSGQNIASAGFDRNQPWAMPNSSYLSGGTYVANTGANAIPIYATTYNDPNNAGYSPVTALESLFGGSLYNTVADNFILDATAFKLREVSLNYTLPKSVLANTGVRELTFGIHARNPFQKYAKENKGYNDPETSFSASQRGYANSGQYPEIKTWGANITVGF